MQTPSPKLVTMTFNEYVEEVENLVKEAINDPNSQYLDMDNAEEVRDEMWIDDAITGNGSGSFYGNSAQSKESALDLAFDEDFHSELGGLGDDMSVFTKGPEHVDVTARCLALGLVDVEGIWTAAVEARESGDNE